MRFSFHRGSLALDFVGTVGQRSSPTPEERLTGGQDLRDWLREAGLPAPAQVSEADLALARRLREAIDRLGTQALEGKPLGRAPLSLLNAAAGWSGAGAVRLNARGKREFVARSPLRFSLARIAEDAIERLSSDADRLTRCKLPGCGALLLSRSRSDPRRWCTMETCGNRAKVAAFRRRERRR